MKIINLNKSSSKPHLKKTCAAIGIFDGVHRGHQYLIEQMLSTARRLGALPIIITFFPHPAHVLRPDLKLGYLISLEERFRLLGGLGIAACVVVPFDRAFARIQPRKFIKDILTGQLGVKAVFVGNDFRFGKDRSGDIALLQELGPEYGYETHAVSGFKQGKEIISSTRIRRLVEAGKLNEAGRLLGRHVSVSGVVVKGSERGKSLGYPTANVEYDKFTHPRGTSFILPPYGVYVVRALLGKKSYPAMANIGTRPSFEKQISKVYLEVHILDFSKDIYGKHLDVEFLKKVRNEKKFSSPQGLVRQIRKDESLARKYFAQNPQ